MQSDSTTICDIHQQINNVIFIYVILQNTMPIAPAIQSKINNVS